jgi:hypothetical protein
MQVCAIDNASDEAILEVCNKENPSGTTGGWQKVERKSTKNWPNIAPVPCDDYPGRTHFLVSC